MKKFLILFALITMFMLQLTVVRAEDNVNIDVKYNNLETNYVSCGEGMIKDVPITIPRVVNVIYLIIQISVPIILVVMGTITLVKSVISSKEDDIKKAQLAFVKKLIAGAIVFFAFVIMKLVISIAADANKSGNIIDCANCFLNGTKNCNTTVSSKKNS